MVTPWGFFMFKNYFSLFAHIVHNVYIFVHMEKNKTQHNVNPAKLYTKSKYAQDFKLARNTINTYIKTGKLTGVPINGTTLVLDESSEVTVK